jgi:hypothetical protein
MSKSTAPKPTFPRLLPASADAPMRDPTAIPTHRTIKMIIRNTGVFAVDLWTEDQWEATPEGERPDSIAYNENAGLWFRPRFLREIQE